LQKSLQTLAVELRALILLCIEAALPSFETSVSILEYIPTNPQFGLVKDAIGKEIHAGS
jgi:hypothetical protein